MIVVDLETTGLSPTKNSILSIGAISLDSNEEFYEECRVEEGAEVSPMALRINGFTEDQIYDVTKQYAVEIYLKFLRWAEEEADNLLAGENVGHFDILFLEELHRKSGLSTRFPFSYRTVDLHTLAYRKFGKSLSHKDICEELGLESEPLPHNALSGAKSELKCIKLLLQ